MTKLPAHPSLQLNYAVISKAPNTLHAFEYRWFHIELVKFNYALRILERNISSTYILLTQVTVINVVNICLYPDIRDSWRFIRIFSILVKVNSTHALCNLLPLCLARCVQLITLNTNMLEECSHVASRTISIADSYQLSCLLFESIRSQLC